MIALVIVSHSREISDGLKRMADAMSRSNVPIVSAGGMDDGDDTLGTDATRVLEAIQSVSDHDGVLVFAAIGSAKLSAEMAISLLDEPDSGKVRFCDAPLVEGILAAAVQSAAGGGIEAVAYEAETAYQPPEAAEEPQEVAGTDTPHSEDALVRDYTIANPLGLHARPAALFVTEMNRHQADVRIRNATKNGGFVNAKSINRVVTLDVTQNNRITVSAEGEDAEAVHAAIVRLVDEGFGEEVPASAKAQAVKAPAPSSAQVRQPVEATIDTPLKGIPIAEGYAVAEARHHRTEMPEVQPHAVADPDAEVRRFDDALAQARRDIESLKAESLSKIGDYQAKIFDAHLLQLADPEIVDEVRGLIRSERMNAEAAWQRTLQAMVEAYLRLDDKLLRARGEDLGDVGARVMGILTGAEAEALRFDRPVILCVDRLRPSDVPLLDLQWVQGVCAETGSKMSHAGILASGLGIPVAFGLGLGLATIPNGEEILLDGGAGTLDPAPDAQAIKAMEQKRADWQARKEAAERVKFEPAITRDGVRCRVAANMRDLQDLEAICASGAEEVGLFRTEFLFLNRDEPPDEDEQRGVYREAVKTLEGRPLVIRTMDIGGDKPVPYLSRDPEDNPNLGWRGIRHSLDNPELFQSQLKAILRAGADGPVRIMFPMVSSLSEVQAAKAQVKTATQTLTSAKEDFASDIETGIMIEVPAAAEMADKLAPHVDFFSIGTNDLTQYVMAADRGNAKVAPLFDPFHPAVLRAIRRTIDAAKANGIWVGMCGAMAGDVLAAPILIGMGLEEFSMNATQVPAFKLQVMSLSFEACRTLAAEVAALDGAAEVRGHVEVFLKQQNT